MFKRKGKNNKEKLGLLEDGSCNRVSMENWQPQSEINISTQQEQELGRTSYSKEDQMILSMGVERPQRQYWMHSKNNPFEETSCGDNLFDGEIEGESTNFNVSIFDNHIQKQNQVSHNQTLSNDKHIFSSGLHPFGNPLNVRTTTTVTFNQTMPSDKLCRQYAPLCRGSSFNTINPSAPTQRILNRGVSLPLHQQVQNDLQNLSNVIEKPGEFSDIPSSSSENDTESSDIVQEKRKKKKKKAKKSKKSKVKAKNMFGLGFESDSSCNEMQDIAGGPESREKKKKKKRKKKPSSESKTEALSELLRGTAMLKFPRRGRSTPHFKFVQLVRSKNTYYLQWFSKKKPLKTTTINVAFMDHVLKGNQSDVVKRFHEHNFEKAAFSIKYRGEHIFEKPALSAKYRGELSLDLVAKHTSECTMWVTCLKELIQRAKKGKLVVTKECWISGLNYVDKNRPKRELTNISLERPNKVTGKSRGSKIDFRLHQKNNIDVRRFQKRYRKLKKMASNVNVRNSYDYDNLMVSLTALEDRLEELAVETQESRDSELSKRDIWRFGVDLGTLEEKVKVLQYNKYFHLL